MFSAGDTYANIKKRLSDMLDVAGDSVTDLELDLLNRAQRNLLMVYQWDGLVKEATLTLTNDAATLPADCNSIIDVYHDSDSNNKQDFHYYENSTYDNGYKITNSFAKATGHSRTITFFRTPDYDPKLVYWGDLDDFAGTGTEYSYFPPDLLLQEALYIHASEEGVSGSDLAAIVNRREELIQNYKMSSQFRNRNMKIIQNDEHGEPIDNDQYSLDGSRGGLEADQFEPDYDLG